MKISGTEKVGKQIMPKFMRQICPNCINDLHTPCEILIRFDRLYFVVGQAEPEK